MTTWTADTDALTEAAAGAITLRATQGGVSVKKTTSANVAALLSAANYAAVRTLLDLEPGIDFYSIGATDSAISGAISTHVAAGNPHTQYALESSLGTAAFAATGDFMAAGSVTQYTDEMARDALGTALTAGTGITITPNDGADTITVAVDTTAEAERTRDTIGAALVAGSNVTITVDDAGNTITIAASGGGGGSGGREEIWIPAAAMIPQVTNGAAEGSGETTTNDVMRRTLDFDPTTAEYAQFSWRMPKRWNEGTVTFIPIWSHPSTTTNFGVVWDMCGVAISNDDALDAAFGTAQTSTDTGGTTDDLYEGPESSAITIAGTPAAGDVVHFRVARAPSNGSDTMAVDARLHGVVLVITTDAATDA